MSAKNTRICCCEATTWTAVFGWIQIMVSVSALLGAVALLVYVELGPAKDPKFHQGFLVLLLFTGWMTVLTELAALILGILLIIGNKREKLNLLWMWMVLSAMVCSGSTIVGIVAAAKLYVGPSLVSFLSAAIMGFGIYCVHIRIKDITAKQRLAGVGYNDGKLDSSPAM